MNFTNNLARFSPYPFFTGALVCVSAVMLLGGCQTVRPPNAAPAPCTPGDPKEVPGQSVPDRFVPVVKGDVVSDAVEYKPCEVIANTPFKMGAEYDWVPNSKRGKVKLWLEATATTPDGKVLVGDEIFSSANAPVEFDLTWGKGDAVGRTIVRFIDLTPRQDVEPGTQIRVRLRDPGESGEWPGSTSVFGPVAVLNVVEKRQSDSQGDAGVTGAAEGDYQAWAILAPCNQPGPVGKTVKFTMKVNKKPVNP